MKEKKIAHEVEAQLDDFFNAPVESAPHTDHLYGLRVRLLEAGHIQTLMQKYVYTDEAKEMCLEWYLEDLARQDELGSTGSWGKQFEVESRISYAIRRGVPFLINDTKCRSCGLRDMTIRVDGGNYAVELKVGGGAVAYGCDKVAAEEAKREFFRRNPIIVWDYRCNGQPLCMKAYDLLKELASYKKGLGMWFVDTPNYDKNLQARKGRSYQIQFALRSEDEKKLEFLDTVKAKGFKWESLITWAEFEMENE